MKKWRSFFSFALEKMKVWNSARLKNESKKKKQNEAKSVEVNFLFTKTQYWADNEQNID